MSNSEGQAAQIWAAQRCHPKTQLHDAGGRLLATLCRFGLPGRKDVTTTRRAVHCSKIMPHPKLGLESSAGEDFADDLHEVGLAKRLAQIGAEAAGAVTH